jgi:transcriptional regulator with XRE-family HTH domain
MSKNMEDTGFKERLRGVMNVKELQRKDLITLGFGGPRVDKWLAGHRKPRDQALRKIADWLEVSVDYLFGRRPDLEELEFRGVAVRESLDTFLRQERQQIPQEVRPLLERIAESPKAPITVDQWRTQYQDVVLPSIQFGHHQGKTMRRMLRQTPPHITGSRK